MKSKVLYADRYGHSEVLQFEEVEMGPLASGHARIQVKAAGINPIDVRRMTGEVRFGSLPLRFGGEFSGVILELAGDHGDWRVGDEVLGSAGPFMAQVTVTDVPVGNLIRRPASMDWTVAASIPGTGQTAMTLIRELGPVRSLLVHGGAGGVGTALVQIARDKGMEVVATASPANHDYLRGLGATPVAYGPGLAARIQELHPAPFDAAAILSGTQEATEVSLATVKPDGPILSITGIPSSSQRVRAIVNQRDRDSLQYVVDRVADGRFQWEVSQTYPFEKAAEGFEALLTGHGRGKRVLVF